MTNQDILQKLRRLHTLLVLGKRSNNLALAIRRALDAIANWKIGPREMVAKTPIKQLFAGYGPKFIKIFEELINTGNIAMIQKLQPEFDPFFCYLCEIPGIGETMARRMFFDRSIHSMDDLRIAYTNNVLQRIPAFGDARLQAIENVLWISQHQTNDVSFVDEPAPSPQFSIPFPSTDEHKERDLFSSFEEISEETEDHELSEEPTISTIPELLLYPDAIPENTKAPKLSKEPETSAIPELILRPDAISEDAKAPELSENPAISKIPELLLHPDATPEESKNAEISDNSYVKALEWVLRPDQQPLKSDISENSEFQKDPVILHYPKCLSVRILKAKMIYADVIQARCIQVKSIQNKEAEAHSKFSYSQLSPANPVNDELSADVVYADTLKADLILADEIHAHLVQSEAIQFH